MFNTENRIDLKRSGTQRGLLGSKVDTGVGKSLVEAQQRKNGQKDYEDLRKKYMVVLRENTKLKKELAKHKGIPFE